MTARETKSFPPLSAPMNTEVAIIGGGISGLTCAYLLSKAGKKVILVEAQKIGSGTTGRSTGNLYSLVDFHVSKLIQTWDKKIAKDVVTSRSYAINFIETLVKELNIPCSFERVSFHYFLEKEQENGYKALEDEFVAALDLGYEAQFIKDTGILPFSIKKILEIKHQAQFHPLNYIRGLTERVSDKVQIFENSPVADFDAKTGIIQCNGFTIKTNQIIMATHTPKGVSSLHFKMTPIREHGMAAPLKTAPFKGIFWDIGNPKRSIRTLNFDHQSYVIAIGNKFKPGHESNTKKENEILDSYMSSHFNVGPERYWWGAQAYQASDHLPYIGEKKERLFTLTGFATDGLVYGTLGAMIISDLILHRENPFSELYKATRMTPVKSSKLIIKDGFDNLSQYAKDLPRPEKVFIKDIQVGEARVAEHNGEMIALYRESETELHAVSAVCTHMKCIVSFNSAEKSWDCPCHASRFDLKGKVLEGPAMANLPIKKDL